NEALLDFAVEKNRDKMKRALAEVRGQLGRTYRLVVDNKEIETKSSLVSRNPSDTSQIIGTVSAAETQHVNQAVDAAKKALPKWAAAGAAERANYLLAVADEMRRRRCELAAWQILECGKGW